MTIIESQFDGGESDKKECDFCNEAPENEVLIEKPNSMIVNGKLILSHRPNPLYICLGCLAFDIENL